jgi:hypothetical protein
VGTPAPQLEHPARPHTSASDKHPPVGYGAIPPAWSPRKDHAGTFDDVWMATRMPLMPLDHDPRTNNAAHPSLVFDPHLAPGDAIAILGMSESGALSFRLPPFPLVLRGHFDRSGKVEVRPPIDTLLVEPGSRRVELAVRHAFPIGRGLDVLREITAELSG